MIKYQPSIKAELAADAKIKLVKNFIFFLTSIFIWIYWIIWKSIFECRKRYLDYLLTGLEERHLSIKLVIWGWEHPNWANSGRTWKFDKFNQIVIFQFYLFDSKNDQMKKLLRSRKNSYLRLKIMNLSSQTSLWILWNCTTL